MGDPLVSVKLWTSYEFASPAAQGWRVGAGIDCQVVQPAMNYAGAPAQRERLEWKIDYGPGYRRYCKPPESELVALLTSAAKSSQNADSRAFITKALREGGNPSFAAILKVFSALSLRLHMEPSTADG